MTFYDVISLSPDKWPHLVGIDILTSLEGPQVGRLTILGNKKKQSTLYLVIKFETKNIMLHSSLP